MKNHLNDFQVSAYKVYSCLDPEFRLIVYAEPAFTFVITDKIGPVIKDQYVGVIHPEEISSVSNDIDLSGHTSCARVSYYHVPDFFFGKSLSAKGLLIFHNVCEQLCRQKDFSRILFIFFHVYKQQCS